MPWWRFLALHLLKLKESEMQNIPDNELIFYQTEDSLTKVKVRLLDETVWLNHKTKCIGLLTGILRLKLFILGQILRSQNMV